MQKDELKTYSLLQVKDMLSAFDERMANNYITENLAVARNFHPKIVPEFVQKPFHMDEMRIFVVMEGWTEPTINLLSNHFSVGELVFIGPNGLAQVNNASPDLKSIAVSVSSELFGLALGNRIPKAFDGHIRDFHFPLQPDELEFFDTLHRLLYDNISKENGSMQVTLHLISTILWYVDSLWQRNEDAHRQSQSREQQLFADFIQFVNKYAPQQHNIGFYADRLFISARYMSSIVKKVSGKSAKEWIDNAIVTKAKVELRHTDKQVNEISDEMNFPNTAFFCKFFKRLSGMTPMEYKQS